MEIGKRKIQNYHQSIKEKRKNLLDLLQVVYGHHDNWINVRSRILKLFGRDGLEGDFLRLIEDTEHGERKDEKKESIL